MGVHLAFRGAFQHHLGQPRQQPTRPGQAHARGRARSASSRASSSSAAPTRPSSAAGPSAGCRSRYPALQSWSWRSLLRQHFLSVLSQELHRCCSYSPSHPPRAAADPAPAGSPVPWECVTRCPGRRWRTAAGGLSRSTWAPRSPLADGARTPTVTRAGECRACFAWMLTC
jgi:hypothetical protein